MPSSYIISGCRTPIGKFLGGLAKLQAVELGALAVAGAVERSGIEQSHLQQIIMGQVIQAGTGQAPARQAGTLAGLPNSIGAVTVNKVCGSGLYSVMLADMAIRAGEYRHVVAGGMESMSSAPHLLRQSRSGWKFGEQPLIDAIDFDGLRCPKLGLPMGCIAEWTAKEFAISRHDQDAWAARSHQLAKIAADTGRWDMEVIPVQTTENKKTVIRGNDECTRSNCTTENLSMLPPLFDSPLVATDVACPYTTSVTAGNASTLSDGAAAVVVVDENTMLCNATQNAFRIVGHCTFASDHQKIFTAPVGAIEMLLAKTGKRISEVDLFEINEAFAAQVLACVQSLKLDLERVNVCGGAIALGHPLGCSGTRILVTLMNNLLARNLTCGIASLCLGGGEAVAMMIERSA